MRNPDRTIETDALQEQDEVSEKHIHGYLAGVDDVVHNKQ